MTLPDPPQPTPPTAVLPTSIRRAVYLMYVGAAISVAGIGVNFIERNVTRDQFLRRDVGLDRAEADDMVTIVLIVGVAVGLAAVALWLWIAERNRAGKTWARTFATILGVLVMVGGLLDLLLDRGDDTALGRAVRMSTIVLALAIVVLLHRPDSTRHYEGR